MSEQKGYRTIYRGVLSAAAGSGEHSKPGSDGVLTLYQGNVDLANNNIADQRIKRFALSIYSSHASATNGVSFEESLDGGTNWDVLVQYTLAATTYTKYYVAVSAPLVRVKYTNSTNVLTSWRLALLADDFERGTVA